MRIVVKKSFYDEYFETIEKSQYIKKWKKGNKWRYKYSPNHGGKENHYRGKNNQNETDMILYTKLDKKKIKNLKPISDEDFSEYVDKLLNKQYSKMENIIRLPDLNNKFKNILHLGSTHCFICKGDFSHARPERKQKYGQELREEELKRIPHIIKKAKKAYIDHENKNFFIPFADRINNQKLNKITFNRDKYGNFFVTMSKVDRISIERNKINLVEVGVAPTIPQTMKSVPITAFSESQQDYFLSNDRNNFSILRIAKMSIPNQIKKRILAQ